VGAVHWADDALEPYSSRGPTADGRIKPDIAAPSVVDSASYVDEGFNGTSAATPHVAGAAALVMQAHPEFKGDPQALAEFLQGLAVDLGDSGPDNTFGAGRLSLGDAPQPELAEAPAAAETDAERDIRPTSTPRPAPEVGLPGQDIGLPGSSPVDSSSDDADALLGFLVLGGLCLMCLAGLVIMGVALGAIIVAVRRR
jgi:subtilisin family serine protease